jgi:flavin reductase (DIM6/NTAB) family NADH-FMN oxidoreductase RutF
MTAVQYANDVAIGQTIDPKTYRDTMGHYASGVTIIGGFDGREPVGFTCQSFYSVSLTPPLVSFGVMLSSTSYPRIRETGKFSVNVLSDSQHGISNQFARSGADKWAGVPWELTSNENPVIADTLMWLDCSIFAEHRAGDHLIVIGRVHEMSVRECDTVAPLVYFKGEYRHLTSKQSV